MDHDLSPKGWLLGPWKLGRFCFVVSRDDLWIGFYWGRDDGNLYFCPFPMLVFGVRLSEPTTGEDEDAVPPERPVFGKGGPFL